MTVPSWLRDASGRRFVVLGADGFIGSQVVRTALIAGARVTGICIKEPWRLQDVSDGGLEIARVPAGRWWDLQYAAEVAHASEGADALVLLAYEPPPPAASAQRLDHERRVNGQGAVRIAAAARQAGAPVVLASSADVYGPWHDDPVGEEVLPDPATPYAVAKLETEQALNEVCASTGIVSFRIATVFGPGENGPRAIPSFIRALAREATPVVHGDGGDVRDYVYVADVAAAITNASTSVARGRAAVLNLGSGVGRTTIEVLRAVSRVMDVDCGMQFEPSARPPSRLVLAVDRARDELGFEPTPDFEGALAEEVQWLVRHLGDIDRGRVSARAAKREQAAEIED